jgi:hypothetical protein
MKKEGKCFFARLLAEVEMSGSVAERLNIIDTIDFLIFYWNFIS